MSRNRLGDETSPYLLQHKDNPVHWWPWNEEALAEARNQKKPILLSVGYAACHWCHVMAHESFEDDETASVMNELFVNIKVDREERPDVDAIYMNALHALGEHGGWPLTMFLTAEAQPFWGGTYFPKLPRFGRPGFIEVMRQVSRVFAEQPEKVAGNAKALTAHVAPKPGAVAQGEITETLLADAARKISGLTDPVRGGVKGAMKFPQSPLFAFLWRAGIRYRNNDALDAVTRTLTHICQGGIYDHLGGGFARYAVDTNWLVPHFEKMLYDNAQLIDQLSDGYAETRNPLFADRIRETIAWLKREMTVEGGGFASSLDADSEGEEGKFYVWTKDEISELLGEKEAGFFSQWYDVTPDGNWEGKTILNRSAKLEPGTEKDEKRLAVARAKLLKARNVRIRPGFDDKVLADRNGLTIAALAKAGFIFADSAWIDMAELAHQFICKKMTTDGRLSHSWREGKTGAPATATDYAAMIRGALALYAATGVSDRVGEATGWVETLNRYYWSDDLAGYTLAAADTADIIVRPFSGHDDATPNANGMMVSSLMGLWLLTGDDPLRERAERIVNGFSGEIAKNLFAHTSLLSGVLDVVAPAHIVIAAPKGRDKAGALLDVLRKISVPGAAVQVVEHMDAVADASPARGKKAKGGKPTAYVCIGPACAPPVTTARSFSETLEEWRTVRH